MSAIEHTDWTWGHAQARGYAHIARDEVCQDSTSVAHVGDIFIGALADGAGSCRHSHIGSDVAVRAAVSCLQQKLSAADHRSFDSAYLLMYDALQHAIASVAAKAESCSHSPKEYDCTLLIVIASPRVVTAMQVGDGFIVLRHGGERYNLAFEQCGQKYANEPVFLSAFAGAQRAPAFARFDPSDFIAISSDGLENVAIERLVVGAELRLQPHQPLFEDLHSFVSRASDPASVSDALGRWLASEKMTNAKVYDDKSLVIATRQLATQCIQP